MWFTRKFAALTHSERRKRDGKRSSAIIENACSTRPLSPTAEEHDVSSNVTPPPPTDDIPSTQIADKSALLSTQSKDEKTSSLVIVVVGTSNVGKSTLIRLGLQDLKPKQVSIGLKSDLTTLRQVDQHLGEKLGSLFGVELFEVGAFTETGMETIKTIYTNLIRNVSLSKSSDRSTSEIRASDSNLLWIDAISDKKQNTRSRVSPENDYHFPARSPPQSPTSAGFVYAPTRIQNDSNHANDAIGSLPQARSATEITSTPQSDDEHDEADDFTSELPDHSIYPSSFLANRRRGSKDSNDSFGSGLSVDDIIDRLLAADTFGSDENIIPIFITFFRKFMKPNELVNILIERFDNDTTEPQPTRQQERIRSIFCLWMSQYWNDFHNAHTRKTLLVFLERISQKEELRPIRDMLSPLATREPPLEDPDAQWGLADSLIQEDNCLRRSAKKDSGYSESFDITTWFGEDDRKLIHLRRTASTSSVFGRSRKSSISSSINHLLSSVTSNNKTDEKKPCSDSSVCRPEFAGNLISIDPPLCGTSAPPASWASFGTGTISAPGGAANFINTLREKDPMTQKCITFMETPDKALADQLTWIEAELFRKIKPREFVRSIWASSPSATRAIKSWADNQSSASHTSSTSVVAASISHFNFISGWVATMIVTQPKLSKRAAVLEKYLSIAVELRNHNNYNTLMAVLAGINSAAVLRLKQTHELLSEKKIYKQLQSLERLMSSDSSYRLALKQSEPPGIPYLGIHSQDLVSMSEANKDFKADGTIHWEKFRLMGQSIMGMMRFQYPTYDIQPDAKILCLIAEGEVLTEEENSTVHAHLPPTPPPDNVQPALIDNMNKESRTTRCASTSLADLIPAATAALRATRAQNQYSQPDESTLNTAFARALAKVKVQIQTRRLKEKYLAHEWIRLALGLPVDESKINTFVRDEEKTMLRKSDGRTGEIATWYEWRFNKVKFTLEEIETKVDRLRQKKLQHT
ncbi:hypothetical protein EC973_008624 [Apophysomyces ossiformis]|uniref:Ras GEF n=1 Tax=Apophysomyces ossiformis TaxID=679940 RepID=A0A8H7BQ97_9FUNG|nr:hypothetical protein EC973_008624 [Apophysomyces ossiformis]